ncbi:MAG: Ig-like domain-containing protein, partial [Acidimicrobiia bacterium]
VCTDCATPSATWTWTPTGALTDGTHTVAFRSVDSADAASVPAGRSVTVDTTAPAVTITSGAEDGASITNASPVYAGGATDATAGVARVEVSVDGADYTDTDVVCTGCGSPSAAWFWMPTALLADGPHTLAVHSVDGAGFASNPLTRSVTVDTTAPTLTIDAGPVGGSLITDPDPTYSGSATDTLSAVTRIETSFDGGAFSDTDVVCSDCGTAAATWTWTPTTPLSDGAHVVAFRSVDSGGVIPGDPVTRAFTLDTIAPTVAITTGPDDGTTITTGTPTYSGTASDATAGVDQVEVSVDGGVYSTADVVCTDCDTTSATWIWTPTTPLSEGSHTLDFRAVDSAGLPGDPALRSLVVVSP